MGFCCCNSKWSCTVLAVIASVVVGVVAAFLRVTAVITVTPAFLWVTFGIAVATLLGSLLATALNRRERNGCCLCRALTAQLLGALGAILFSVILLAIPFAATSIIGAIFTGILLFFLTLDVTGTACVIKCLADCEE